MHSSPIHARPGPWGPWITFTLGAAIIATYSVAQGLAMLPLIFFLGIGKTSARLFDLPMAGFNMAVATTLTCPVMLAMCGVAAWVRQGPKVDDYLAIVPIGKRRVAGWVLLIFLFSLGLSFANEYFGRPVPEFIERAYSTAGWLPFFWGAISISAPVAEEVLFRGFLFAGFAASRLGKAGAVALTALVFMGLHVQQYDRIDMLQIGLVGILLGIARAKSGSLLPPLAMHITLNLTSLCLYHFGDAPT